ncbi:hypothetical protein Cgig2_017291 [Carnegiea gigantea]|uniref:Cytochrome P450 n=1 Tax=Carnegiea gigantea TaxID=171969 RepID=A0A9Q1KHT7_9CARY|nr:hypothetical protein Cgig2_017291 [Carnegiea gigantea]
MDYLSFLLCLLPAWLTIHFLLSSSLKEIKLSSKNKALSLSSNQALGKNAHRPYPSAIFGKLFKLGTKPQITMAELAKTCGPIMILQLGQLPTVIISSGAVAREVLQKNDISISNQTIPNGFCAVTIPNGFCAVNHHESSLAWSHGCLSQLIGELSVKYTIHTYFQIVDLMPMKGLREKRFARCVEEIDVLDALLGINQENSKDQCPKMHKYCSMCGQKEDSSSWENPNSFDPERFLGKESDVKDCDFELIPFGAGHRTCPRMPMGMRMLHLMSGSLIHRFDRTLEEGITPENMDIEQKIAFTLAEAEALHAIPTSV